MGSDYQATSYLPTITRELEVMGVIETAMTAELCNAERWRIARWVSDKWKQPPPPRDED